MKVHNHTFVLHNLDHRIFYPTPLHQPNPQQNLAIAPLDIITKKKRTKALKNRPTFHFFISSSPNTRKFRY